MEYRCCKEINAAEGEPVFDVVIDTTPWITMHGEYLAMTNAVVLKNVGPLLRRRDGRSYRRGTNQSQNE